MRWIFMMTALLCVPFVQANIVVDKPIIHFSPNDPSRQDVEIFNSGTENLYVQMTVYKVLNPIDDQSERQELSDPRTTPLLASPNRMVIPPKQKKLLRLVVRQPAKSQDDVYRVRVEPKVGDVDTEANIGIKVLLAYDLLVIVRPPDAQPNIAIERQGNQLHFANRGNTSVQIRQVQQCQTKDDCLELGGNRLYVGEEWTVDLPYEGAVEVYESYGLRNTVRNF